MREEALGSCVKSRSDFWWPNTSHAPGREKRPKADLGKRDTPDASPERSAQLRNLSIAEIDAHPLVSSHTSEM